MPVFGATVRVEVMNTPFGGLVSLINGSGSRRTFRVGDEVRVVDGNTSTGLVVDDVHTLVVTTDEDGQIWPRLVP